MSNPPALLPCPWCPDSIVGTLLPDEPDDDYCIWCMGCCAHGPSADTYEEAAQLWNRRVDVK